MRLVLTVREEYDIKKLPFFAGLARLSCLFLHLEEGI